jgi:mono/diheme cytochrome c family protein
MHQFLASLRRSLSFFPRPILLTYLSLIAILITALGSMGCSNPLTRSNSSTTAPPPSPTNSAISLPVEVTEETKNPLPDLTAAANLGQPLYQANCALCHGDLGASDGPASSSYDPRPTDLTKGKVTTDPDGKIFLITKHGKGKMPGMKRLTDEQIWQIVAYVRTLAKK